MTLSPQNHLTLDVTIKLRYKQPKQYNLCTPSKKSPASQTKSQKQRGKTLQEKSTFKKETSNPPQ